MYPSLFSVDFVYGRCFFGGGQDSDGVRGLESASMCVECFGTENIPGI